MKSFKGEEILDEWEWPRDFQAQREIERHLRCQICGDFFHGPVLLPCSHTFCSTCVRRFLQTKGANGLCPQCKQSCTPQELVPNRALEQVALLFEQSKPELLKKLRGIGDLGSSTVTPNTGSEKGIKKSWQDKPERMPLLSYNVMTDKEVRKLLGAINVRVLTKNREEIIQIHKEFVLLSNAQADSVNPKSTAQLREEVVRNHHARMQQKAKTDALKRAQSGNENAASPVSVVSLQMRANFDKLRQDIADRKAGKRPPTPSTETSSTNNTPQKEGNGVSVGVWRHFCALDTSVKQEFYVNSVTHEIRVELPSPFVHEQSPANRYDDLGGVARAVADRDPVGHGDAAKAVTPLKSKAKAKRAIAAAFASPDATSEFQRATEETVISDNDGEDIEEKQEQTDAHEHEERESLGKHARSTDGAGLAADDSIEVLEDAGAAASKWQCSRCTLINEATCQQCEACGFEPASISTKRRIRKKMHFQSKIALS